MIARRALLVCAVLLSAACARTPTAPQETPDWLASLIAEFERDTPGTRPPFVARYQFQGAIVYYVAPRCCDVYSDLYTTAGTIVCHPDGGITGSGDGRCPSFAVQRKDEHIVWRDPASSP